jgi:hypothetical protein
MFGWTAEGPWAFFETRPYADGALQIWRTFQTTDRALGGFGWVPDAVTVQDASPESTDGVVYGDLVIDRGQL